MVRLKVVNPEIGEYFLNNFNSNMVRLKGLIKTLMVLSFQNFNSNMVRLKAAIKAAIPITIKFQFQYGAIKRR